MLPDIPPEPESYIADEEESKVSTTTTAVTDVDDPLFKRRQVLRDTVAHFQNLEWSKSIKSLALANVDRWNNVRKLEDRPSSFSRIQVFPGDWGDVTLHLTRMFGTKFTVLNMANAYVPGGGCDEGMPAQEENIWRRSDCRLRVPRRELSNQAEFRRYNRKTTNLINGPGLIDTHDTRTCIKGPEIGGRGEGYEWLPANEVFPFTEFRSAALDRRSYEHDPAKLSILEISIMQNKIRAQLDTLHRHNQRNIVLGAFGCGAFRNPAADVAQIYSEALEAYKDCNEFDVVAFAIYDAGYGPASNFDIFHQLLHNQKL